MEVTREETEKRRLTWKDAIRKARLHNITYTGHNSRPRANESGQITKVKIPDNVRKYPIKNVHTNLFFVYEKKRNKAPAKVITIGIPISILGVTSKAKQKSRTIPLIMRNMPLPRIASSDFFLVHIHKEYTKISVLPISFAHDKIEICHLKQ